MGALIDQIKAERIQAMKDRDSLKKDLLTTLVGDIDIVGKDDGGRETTDEEAVTLIKSFLKNNTFTLESLRGTNNKDNDAKAIDVVAERRILESYLPTQMSEDDLKAALAAAFVSPLPKKGELMGYLKKTYPGLYDGKVAAGVVDALLAGEAVNE